MKIKQKRKGKKGQEYKQTLRTDDIQHGGSLGDDENDKEAEPQSSDLSNQVWEV